MDGSIIGMIEIDTVTSAMSRMKVTRSLLFFGMCRVGLESKI